MHQKDMHKIWVLMLHFDSFAPEVVFKGKYVYLHLILFCFGVFPFYVFMQSLHIFGRFMLYLLKRT